MRTERPCFVLFPALPLESGIQLGSWIVGTPPESVLWRSARFEELAGKLLASFSKIGFEKGAVVYHSGRGIDGSLPSDDELRAIQAAVRFAALDANDDVLGTHMPKHQLVTSENGELYVQGIDEDHGRVVRDQGGALRRELAFGLQLGEQPSMPDAVRPVTKPVRLAARLARAVFCAFEPGTARRKRRVQIAVEWHAAALANPRAVTLQHRLIALKTGFEALMGTSNSRECARRLRQLFERAAALHSSRLPWAGLLWSPRERVDLARTSWKRDGRTEPDTRSELEDWFMTLAEARNQVIHEGVLSITEFQAPPERPLSRYAGQLFWVGERVLREAVKATLGADVLLEGLLLVSAELKELATAFPEVRGDEADGAGVQDSPPAAENLTGGPRTCEQLLAGLVCGAANQVVLSKAVAGCSASWAAAHEAARRMRDHWVANAGERSVLITSAERDLLERAGAEPELRRHWRRCE